MIDSEAYARDGFVLARGAVPIALLDGFEERFLGLLPGNMSTTRSKQFADLLLANRDLEQRVYSEVRQYPWALDVASDPSLANLARALIGQPCGVLEKIPLRVDLPLVTRELAVWHQDYFYVRGNTETVTAWLPLQDTEYELGCLQIMPRSQLLGPVPHERNILSKKFYPTNHFDREIRYVEMKRGDVLFFHSLLLHASGLNISDRARLSLQARYSPTSLPTDPSMGSLIPLRGEAQA